MKKVVYITGLAVLLVSTFLAGHWYTIFRNTNKDTTSAERRILYYVDPMNPTNTSDKPGLAPCGMKMEPVYADEGSTGQASGSATASMPPGTVRITPEKQQLIGVRIAVAEKISENHSIRTVGRIAPDEKRVYRLVAGTDGWIRETYNNDTGTLVKKGERLAAFYSPQFRAAQLSYLSLYGVGDDRSHPAARQALAPSQQASISVQTYIDALESLGMSKEQINELASTKQLTDKVYIISPTTGFILSRDVSPGQRFDKGAEWYRIADLSKVWVLADFFRNEADYVRPGMKVKVTLPNQKKEFQAVVSTVLPQFDAASRTLKVRLELDNPGYILRPDMFVDVEFPVTLPPALTVPTDAVLDSGLKKTVFVDRGGGFFEPRLVETGWSFGDRVEITKGLMPGEQIVISGNFLIDSESRMKMAAAGMQGTTKQPGQRVKDPICGMEVDPKNSKGAGLFIEHGGKSYYFCMPECKQEFEKDPARYARPAEKQPPAAKASPGATGR
jgi:Cu(I)/Ag(I) efflux system membrane fusion protein